jgi:hypothetical protein
MRTASLLPRVEVDHDHVAFVDGARDRGIRLHVPGIRPLRGLGAKRHAAGYVGFDVFGFRLVGLEIPAAVRLGVDHLAREVVFRECDRCEREARP